MARIYHTGFELNSLALEGYTVSGSNMAAQSSLAINGTYSLRSNPTAAASRAQIQFSPAANKELYLRFNYQVATHAANDISLMSISDAGFLVFPFRLRSTGSGLKVIDNTATIVGSGFALNTNQTYRIEVYCLSNAAAGVITVKVDGSTVVSASGLNTGGNDMQYMILGTSTSDTHDWYMDDLAINDTTTSFQNTYPGDGKIIFLRPNAAGDVNTYGDQRTGGTAGAANDFTRINEVPPDDATTFNGSATLNQEGLFNCTDSGIGVSDTVNVVSVGGRFRNNTADPTAVVKFEIEKTAAGTISQSAAITPNSTTWFTNSTSAVLSYPITLYQDPDAAAWTKTTLDSMQIGYKLTTGPGTAGRRIDVTSVWALVDYTPFVAPPAATPGGTLTMMGV